MTQVKRAAFQIEFIGRFVTESVKVFALVAFKGYPCRPQTVFSHIIAVSVMKSKFFFFFNDHLFVVIESKLAVSFKLDFELANSHKNTIVFVLKFRLSALGHQGKAFVILSAVGERLKTNCIVMAGCNSQQLIASCKQNAVVNKFCIIHFLPPVNDLKPLFQRL